MAIRITGGEFKGRLLDVPGQGVRPTQDKVRAAVFSSLQAVVPGARVLDLFAGTGAFGLEALGRGAAFACFVESGRKTIPYLKKNIERLLGDPGNIAGQDRRKWEIVPADVGRFLTKHLAEKPFDIVFADPPYEESGEWTKNILFNISRGSILASGAYLIIESSAKLPLIEASGWRICRERTYGETRICIYKLMRT